ncbi:MAG: hypothetical protein AAGJ38_04805, partial [Planctomycetota bacterium]
VEHRVEPGFLGREGVFDQAVVFEKTFNFHIGRSPSQQAEVVRDFCSGYTLLPDRRSLQTPTLAGFLSRSQRRRPTNFALTTRDESAMKPTLRKMIGWPRAVDPPRPRA